MAKGSRKKSSGGSRGVAAGLPKLQEDVWAQCDNHNCQKWRRLPPGTVIDEDTPWYCYMNPDDSKAACEAPEESYNLDMAVKYEEPAYDDYKPSSSRKAKGRASDRRSSGRASHDWSDSRSHSSQDKKRRMSLTDEPYEPKRTCLGSSARDEDGSGEYQPDGDRPEALGAAGGMSDLAGASSGGIRHSTRPKRPPSLPLKEESPPPPSMRSQGGFRQPQSYNRSSSSKAAQAAALRPTQKARKQHKGFEKLLSLGGLWEIVKGKGKAITPAPFWVWEGLATHTPAAAELAAQAADVASAAKYFEGNQYPSGAALASEAAALKREAMTAAAVLGLDITSRIPDVIAPIPARKAPVAQQQVAQQPPAVQQQAQPVAQQPVQIQTAAQSYAQQPATLQAGAQPQQPAQPSQTQTLVMSSAPSQQLQTHQLSAPQLPPPRLPTYSPAQLLSLVMPNLQAQSQALQNGVHHAATVQPTHMPGHAQSSQPTAEQPLQASQSNPVEAQSQAQPQSGANVQAQLPRQQPQPQPQQAFSFLNLLQQEPNSAAVQKGLLDQLSGQSSGQQLPGLLLPTVSGQMQQVPNVAGLMQLLQQQAQAQQQAIAQQPASKHVNVADAPNATE